MGRIVSKRMDMEKMVLFSIGYLEENLEIADLIGKKSEMCSYLSIKESSLSQYLSRLKNNGRLKRAKGSGVWLNYSMTLMGQRDYESFKEEIMSKFLIPERHGVNKVITISSFLSYLKDPFEHIFLVKCYLTGHKIDIHSQTDLLRAYRKEERDLGPLKEMLSAEEIIKEKSLETVLEESSLFGMGSLCPLLTSALIEGSIESVLIYADLARRRGHIKEAFDIYERTLSRSEGIGSALWIVSFIGMLQCRRYSNKDNEVISTIDSTLSTIDNPVQKAMMKKIKADILSDMKDFSKASDLYRYCLKVFDRKNYPLLRCAVINNLGVMYMRKGAQKEAKRQWEDALTLLRSKKIAWSFAVLLVNLSDVYSLEGDFIKAHCSLDKAGKIFRTIGDAEGLSGIHFNRALVLIEEGEFDSAMRSIEKMESYPLLYKNKVEERRSILKERFERKGASDLVSLLNPPSRS